MKSNEQQGIGVTYIHAGKYKVEGHPDAPLDKEARAEMQRHVNRYYRMFVESVARNRGATPERVEAEFGQGRIIGAEDAVMRGMANRFGTFAEAVWELSGRLSARDRMSLRRRRVAMYANADGSTADHDRLLPLCTVHDR